MAIQTALQDLTRALRASGIEVSPAEVVEAGEVARAVGVGERELLRLALRLALCKSTEARGAFDAAFDGVFFSGVGGGGRKKGQKQRPDGEPGGEGRGRGAGEGQPPQQDAEDAEPRSRRPSREQRDLRGKDQREAGKQSGPTTELSVGEGRPAEGPQTRFVVPRLPPSSDADAPLARRDLDADLPEVELARLAPALLRRLSALKLVRRRRPRPSRRGQIDVHRALRRNLGWGGIPLDLPRRRPGRRPPRLLLLVDVSHSCVRAGGLFLLAAARLAHKLRDTRVALFVDRPVDATRAVRRWLSGALPAAPRSRFRQPGEHIRPTPEAPGLPALLAALPDLRPGAPSDYGRTIEETQRLWQPLLDRRSAVVIVGDARTNRFPPCPWLLEEIAARVRRVVWLVPEAAERWGTGDSALFEYAPACDAVVEATTLDGLTAGVRELLRLLR